MPKYGKAAQKSVEKAMHKMKTGKLKSGVSGKTVTSPTQAVAIGLSEARKKGAKMPKMTDTKKTVKPVKKMAKKMTKKMVKKTAKKK